MNERTFYLVRHGCSLLQEKERVCLGRNSDPPLSATGRAQAKAFLQSPAFQRISGVSAVYCSDLLRSRETAGILAEGKRQIRRISQLAEMDMGLWDGMTFRQIQEAYPKLYQLRGTQPDLTPPLGESFEDAAVRMEGALRGIMEEHPDEASFLVVVHSGATCAFLCRQDGKDFRENGAYRLPYCGCREVAYIDGGFLLK